MSRSRIAPILRRTPGEAAFDRCFFPVAAVFFLCVVAAVFAVVFSRPASPRGEAELSSNEVVGPAWPVWVAFAAGSVVAFFWIRGVVGVVRVWRDPSARVLRFSALGLLLPLAGLAVRLLLLPFF